MHSQGTQALAKPGVKTALGPLVQDLVGLNNRWANAEINKRWPEIWAAVEPLDLTKSEARQAAWAQYKEIRRAARGPNDKRVRRDNVVTVWPECHGLSDVSD